MIGKHFKVGGWTVVVAIGGSWRVWGRGTICTAPVYPLWLGPLGFVFIREVR